jgi:hypothetical protein
MALVGAVGEPHPEAGHVDRLDPQPQLVEVPALEPGQALARREAQTTQALARREVQTTQELIVRYSPPTAFYGLAGYAASARVHLALWEAGDRAVRPAVLRSCTALRKFARVFPIGQPWA